MWVELRVETAEASMARRLLANFVIITHVCVLVLTAATQLLCFSAV